MRPDPEYHSIHGNPTRPRPTRRPIRSPPPSEPSIPSLDYYLWQCTQGTGEQQMEGCVALWIWCTDDAELFQQTTADGLTSFAGSPGDTIDETDDNTNKGVDFDMSDHSSDDLIRYSIDATANGAFGLEECDFNAEDDGSDDETWLNF
ncbi:BQ5605_C051g12544 [Microbotryum silenes-dioicae]|uniref:BQ5605_C051g12544 protein n=1 Tax=Microbotryum silenes-dioicae TaxID=796604 RepID=A0A2X0MS26_9BASI|nr:BQ5605_C051g12544 [Microbotryum silenes-dioicae]